METRTNTERVLILFAHPALEKSRVHRRLVALVPQLPGITFHDLYEEYPAYDIDIEHEQALLTSHDTIVMQHPFYWYSTPPLLKQWLDLVLEHGWAYGARGTALHGKTLLNVVSAGGPATAYRRGGHNRFTVRELLAPVEQTARLCGMRFLPPYVIFGSHRLESAGIEQEATRFRELLVRLHAGDLRDVAFDDEPTLNDALRRVEAGA